MLQTVEHLNSPYILLNLNKFFACTRIIMIIIWSSSPLIILPRRAYLCSFLVSLCGLVLSSLSSCLIITNDTAPLSFSHLIMFSSISRTIVHLFSSHKDTFFFAPNTIIMLNTFKVGSFRERHLKKLRSRVFVEITFEIIF